MNYLNLDPNFEPLGPSIAFEHFSFSGGEPHIRILEPLQATDSITITCRIRSFNDLGLLLVAHDALQRMGLQDIRLLLPYFPGARQDRLMTSGEALSVKVYAQLINQMSLQKVTILDPHSEVTPALLKQVEVIDNHSLVQQVVQGLADFLLLAPDGGALKKIYKLSTALGVIPVVECSKSRDVKTGALDGFKVYAEDLAQKTCVIVDDICDGGGTFIGLAKALKEKNAGSLILIVTHGIFSKGTETLKHYFERIYCSDAFSTLNDPDVQQIPLKTLFKNTSYENFL